MRTAIRAAAQRTGTDFGVSALKQARVFSTCFPARVGTARAAQDAPVRWYLPCINATGRHHHAGLREALGMSRYPAGQGDGQEADDRRWAMNGAPTASAEGVSAASMASMPGRVDRDRWLRSSVELNIDTFCANSSSANRHGGRAHLTLQDRLVQELRLRGISTVAPDSKCTRRSAMKTKNPRETLISRGSLELRGITTKAMLVPGTGLEPASQLRRRIFVTLLLSKSTSSKRCRSCAGLCLHRRARA